MLGRLKLDAKDAIPGLKAACTDPDEDVRSVAKKSLVLVTEAVDAANREKDLAALEAHLKTLRTAKTPKDKITAIQQLADLGEKAKEAGSAIVSLGILDTNPKVREVATTAYEKIDPPVYKEIIAILRDKDIEVKAQAIHALAETGPKAKAAAPILKLVYVEDRKELIGRNLWEPSLTALTKLTPEDPTVHDAILAIIANPRIAKRPGTCAEADEDGQDRRQEEIDGPDRRFSRHELPSRNDRPPSRSPRRSKSRPAALEQTETRPRRGSEEGGLGCGGCD